jgi:hypothetical protein
MKKKVFKIVLISLSVVVVLFGVLVVHIYMVTKPKAHGKNLQLSRIDFKEPIDSAEANKIRNFVHGLDGVDNTYFNIPAGMLVYGYLPEKQSSENVYNQLMSHGHYKAERFIVDASQVAKGCPVMDPNSFGYRMSTVISKIFN